MTGGSLVLAILVLPVALAALFNLVAPRYAWELNRLFIAWQFADREVPEPSRAWLVYARIAGALVLVLYVLMLLWLFLD